MYSMFSNSNIHKIPFKFRTPEIIKKAQNIYTVEIRVTTRTNSIWRQFNAMSSQISRIIFLLLNMSNVTLKNVIHYSTGTVHVISF